MNQRSALHVVLGIVGLAALIAYTLACRPSWSPDSSKVLFSYFSPEAKEAGVALFDRKTGTTRSIFVQSPVSSPDDARLSVQWDRDGTRAIVSWFEHKPNQLRVLVLPVGSSKPARQFTLSEVKGDALVLPLPEVAENLYIGGDNLARVNLETGETQVRKLEKESGVLLAGQGERIYYAREPDGGDAALEFGELETKALTLQPLFTLKKADLEVHGIEEVTALMAFEPRGSRLAMVGQGNDRDFIILMTKTGFEKVVAPELAAQKYKLGNLEWAPDGKTIYAAVLTPTDKADVAQYSVGEIPADGGPARIVPVARIPEGYDDDFRLLLQVALSPDGTTIATTTGHLPEKNIVMADRALFLVNVRDPRRKVTKIPIPGPQKAAAAAARK